MAAQGWLGYLEFMSFVLSSSLLARYACLVLISIVPCFAQQEAASKPTPDILVFTNGDQLTGKLVHAVDGAITFHSDMAGDINVPLDRVKELRSSSSFAVLGKNQPVMGALVRPGTVQVTDGKLTVTSGAQPIATLPVTEVGYFIDEPTFRRETNPRPSIWYGWNGTLSAGATLVRATQTGTTLTAGVALVRQFPTVSYLPPRNRTILDLTETYGTSRAPLIPQTIPATPDALVKTSIFHADAEQDEYLSRRFYYLAEASFDHNYSLGLQLQQIYGAGVGWTPFSTPKHELNLKADVHYEKQSFFTTPTAIPNNQNLIGSTFAENYRRNFPRGIVFTESGNVIPSWNNPNAYSANVTAGLALPVWKRFAANVIATDNFINNPAIGYQKDSFQFVTGLSYSIR